MSPSEVLALTSEELALVRAVLARSLPGATAWVYGSRATGNPKPFSDLDLAVDAGAPLSLDVLAELRESFDESSLPFKVDVTDLQACDVAFAAIIAGQRVPLGE